MRITLPGFFCNTLPPTHFLTLDTRFQDFLRKHVATDAVDSVLETFARVRVLGKERNGRIADIEQLLLVFDEGDDGFVRLSNMPNPTSCTWLVFLKMGILKLSEERWLKE